MNPGSAPYEAMIAAGWIDKLLVEHGHAKWIEAVAPPVVSPPPSVPSTPTATPPPVVKKLVFKDPGAAPLEDWIKNGWTEEKIVSEGYATFQ
jgi:hypothetical protein